METYKKAINLLSHQLDRMYKSAVKSRNHLLYQNKRGIFKPTVCCAYDKLIFHGNDKCLSINYLEYNAVKDCL